MGKIDKSVKGILYIMTINTKNIFEFANIVVIFDKKVILQKNSLKK